MFKLNSTLNFGIPPVFVFQLKVYYKADRLLTGLIAQRKGTTAWWYSNKTSLVHCTLIFNNSRQLYYHAKFSIPLKFYIVWLILIFRTNSYRNPQLNGQVPSPRAGAAACVVNNFVFVFGGRCKQRRLNDLYSLNLSTMRWTQLDPGSFPDPFAPPSASYPSPRSMHTMVKVGEDTLAVYGGLGQLCAPLNDCWILDIQEITWELVDDQMSARRNN